MPKKEKNRVQKEKTDKKGKKKEENKTKEKEIPETKIKEENLEKKIEIKKSTNLTQNIPQTIEIPFDEEFEESISSSPTLRRMNLQSRQPIKLEDNIIQSTPQQKTNGNSEQNKFNYMPSTEKNDEPKYLSYMNMNANTKVISRSELERQPFNINNIDQREIKFQSSIDPMMQQNPNSAQENFEKYFNIGRKEDLNKDTRNPLEKKEIKYNPEKY